MRYFLQKVLIQPFLPKIRFADEEWFFVMHIPKTAGTTFRFTLYNHLKPSQIYPSHRELKQNSGKYQPGQKIVEMGLTRFFPSRYKVLIGHYQFDFIRYFNTIPRTITFLRHPVDRTLSHLKHIQHLNPNYRALELEAILDRTVKRMTNFQARILGYRPEKNNFNEALENLGNIDFVGISEQFDHSIKLLNRQFDWPLRPVNPMNRIPLPKEKIPESLIEKIDEIIELDLVLYKKAQSILNGKAE